jgi:hypothetical protein
VAVIGKLEAEGRLEFINDKRQKLPKIIEGEGEEDLEEDGEGEEHENA